MPAEGPLEELDVVGDHERATRRRYVLLALEPGTAHQPGGRVEEHSAERDPEPTLLTPHPRTSRSRLHIQSLPGRAPEVHFRCSVHDGGVGSKMSTVDLVVPVKQLNAAKSRLR